MSRYTRSRHYRDKVPRDAVILAAKPLEIHFTRMAAMPDFALTNDLPGALAVCFEIAVQRGS
jgi:hypothetical protein